MSSNENKDESASGVESTTSAIKFLQKSTTSSTKMEETNSTSDFSAIDTDKYEYEYQSDGGYKQRSHGTEVWYIYCKHHDLKRRCIICFREAKAIKNAEKEAQKEKEQEKKEVEKIDKEEQKKRKGQEKTSEKEEQQKKIEQKEIEQKIQESPKEEVRKEPAKEEQVKGEEVKEEEVAKEEPAKDKPNLIAKPTPPVATVKPTPITAPITVKSTPAPAPMIVKPTPSIIATKKVPPPPPSADIAKAKAQVAKPVVQNIPSIQQSSKPRVTEKDLEVLMDKARAGWKREYGYTFPTIDEFDTDYAIAEKKFRLQDSLSEGKEENRNLGIDDELIKNNNMREKVDKKNSTGRDSKDPWMDLFIEKNQLPKFGFTYELFFPKYTSAGIEFRNCKKQIGHNEYWYWTVLGVPLKFQRLIRKGDILVSVDKHPLLGPKHPSIAKFFKKEKQARVVFGRLSSIPSVAEFESYLTAEPIAIYHCPSHQCGVITKTKESSKDIPERVWKMLSLTEQQSVTNTFEPTEREKKIDENKIRHKRKMREGEHVYRNRNKKKLNDLLHPSKKRYETRGRTQVLVQEEKPPTMEFFVPRFEANITLSREVASKQMNKKKTKAAKSISLADDSKAMKHLIKSKGSPSPSPFTVPKK